MKLQVAWCVLAVVGVAAAVPLPSLGIQPANAAARAVLDAIPSTPFVNVDPGITADVTKAILPGVISAFRGTSGTDMDRISDVVNAFLPVGRAVIKSNSEANSDYDTEKYTKQQEAAEATTALILQSVKALVELLPTPHIRTNFNNLVDLSNVPTFDSPFVPDFVVRGQRIKATEFVPEIIIPEIKIQ